MAASSSTGSWRYDVFPSFSGVDVRRGFLSYLLKEFNRKAINSFIDNGIERSHQIADELLLAINQARIAIVIFSKNYASSTWCLDELVEIHKCSKELKQMVIPVFYYVDPSDVRKQKGEFGESFMKTCEGKTDDEIQRWKQALKDVADLAGEHFGNGPSEADMVEKIANDISNKLITSSNGFGDFVGIEAHIKAMKSILCLESQEARMIGIWGQSGIGKSTIGRALFSHLSPGFHFRNFSTDKPMDKDVYGMKLKWEEEFLRKILDQKDLKIENSGVVKERFKDKKVLIVLDDVVNPLFLETLVGKTEWFGPGSRIIVITQDRQILKGHKIDLLYEVKIPAPDIALTILCRSAFSQDSPPDDFKKLVLKVARLAGGLPLGLRVLGHSLKGRTTEEWMELLPGLQNGLDGNIMKTLKVSYDRLEKKDKVIFLWIASLFNGLSVKFINNFFGDGNDGIKRLAEKSLIRIDESDEKYVEMHNLLRKLGREIDREESKDKPGNRRFLTDAKEIEDVFTNQKGTETVLGIFFHTLALESDISIDEKSFQGMSNLQFLQICDYYNRLSLPKGLVYLPPKLKWLDWVYCPLKCLPSNFKAECLVELRMEHSKLEKLWEGTQQLGSLKTITMSRSIYLKKVPDLSKAINLERVDFSWCSKLESFPSPLNSESLVYLDLFGCPRLENFPRIKMVNFGHGTEIEVYDCLWNKNLSGLDYLDCLRRCNTVKFLTVKGNTMEKLCEGVLWFGSLEWMDLSKSENLKEIPDLSKATNLKYLNLSNCKSLVRLPSTIGNLQKLERLEMEECTRLEVLPINVNLLSLKTLKLNGCSSLKSFPYISDSIEELYLDYTAIEEVPCCIVMLRRLIKLSMRGCNKLKNISPNIFRLTNLKEANFTDCGGVITALGDATMGTPIEDPYENIDKRNTSDRWYLNFENCLNLDRDARELIIQSSFKSTVILPSEEVPKYFKHRAFGNSLTVTLPQSSLSHQFLRFNVCLVVESLTSDDESLHLHFRFNGVFYTHVVDVDMPQMSKTDNLVLCSFKIRTTSLPSTSDFNNVEFKFKFQHFVDFKDSPRRIKEVGIRVLNVSLSPDDRDGRISETQCKNLSGEKCDVVETDSGNTQMQISSRIDTAFSPSMELPLGQRGESSSVSFYPCLEGEALCVDSMITEQQDVLIPIVDPGPPRTWWPSWIPSPTSSTSSASSAQATNASIFSCWGGLLKNKNKRNR